MNNQDFILKGKHLLKSPCEDKEKVLHPRTCSDQVLMEHDATSETSLFSWITTPLNPLAPDNEVCTSLIEWLNTYYPLDMEGALPLMSETKKGGAKLGNYLTVNTTTEKLSVDLESLEETLWDDLPIATYSKLGAIIADQNNFELNEAGKLSLKVATSTTFGGAKLGTSLGITDMIAIPNNANFKAFPIGKTVDGKIGALIPNAYLLSGTNWYLDYYRDTTTPEALGYGHVTSPTDSSGNANGINISSPVNYVLLGNTSEYGQMTQPTFALVAGSGIEFEFNLNQGANSFIPTLNFQRNVAEVKIKTSFPAASIDAIGGVKLLSDTPIYDGTETWMPLLESDYDVFPIQLNTDGVMGIKLPRITKATASTLGSIMLGYTSTDDRDYAVQVDSDGKAFVHVPWTGGSGSTITVTGTDLNVTHEDDNYDVQLYEMDKDTLGGGRLIKDADTTVIPTAKEFSEIGNLPNDYEVYIADVQSITHPTSEVPGYLVAKVPKYVDFNNRFTFKFNSGLVQYNGGAATATSYTEFQTALDKCFSQGKTAVINIVGEGKSDDSGSYNLSLATLLAYLTVQGRGRHIEVSLLWYTTGSLGPIIIPGENLVDERTHVYFDGDFPGQVTYSSPNYSVTFQSDGSHEVNTATKYFLYHYKLVFTPFSLGSGGNAYGHNCLTINTYKTIDDYATLFPLY